MRGPGALVAAVATLGALGGAAAPGLVLGGCAARRADAPAETLDRFRRALERGDLDTAYGLMSATYRSATGRAEFERWLRSDPDRLPTLIANLRAAHPEDARLTATVPVGAAGEVKVERSGAGGRWLVDEGALNLYDQSTPRETLRSFIRALERRRWEVLLRFVPDKYRTHMTPDALKAELEEKPDYIPHLLAALKESIDNEIVLSVDRRAAKMRYGAYEVDFLREGDVWKIEDPD